MIEEWVLGDIGKVMQSGMKYSVMNKFKNLRVGSDVNFYYNVRLKIVENCKNVKLELLVSLKNDQVNGET